LGEGVPVGEVEKYGNALQSHGDQANKVGREVILVHADVLSEVLEAKDEHDGEGRENDKVSLNLTLLLI